MAREPDPDSAPVAAPGDGDPPLDGPDPRLAEPPPFWGQWRRIYLALVVLLLVYIVTFYACTVAFR